MASKRGLLAIQLGSPMSKRQSDVSIGSFDLNDRDDNHFENLAKANGSRYWFARDVMKALGYDSWPGFKKAINKAIGACTTLGISVVENFIQHPRVIDGKEQEDFKLSRFACCLTALNGDVKYPQVAAAQVYFIALAEIIHDAPLPPDSAERIVMREEISELEVALSKTVAAAGVSFYDRFQNAGYRGMYNMDYRDLKQFKKIPDMRRSLLDFMRKEELAGNLFRLTLTEGRIKKDGVTGQTALQQVAEQVGRRVRRAMIEETGIRPEDLPVGPDIRSVKRGLKNTDKGFRELDDVAKDRASEREALLEIECASRELVPGCAECASGNLRSHFGSPQCTSGSLASGGSKAHCDCDYCS